MLRVRLARARRLAPALAVLTATVSVLSQDQSAPQAPVFRSRVNFVSVDAYPRRDGQVVPGLTAGDFQIFEDGKPQKVEAFEFVQIAPNPVDADRRDPTSQAEGDALARDPKNRVFVVYLDLAHTTIPGSHAAQRPVVDFLTRTIGAGDLFGFTTAYMPASTLVFGRRTETIEAQLAKFWTWGQSDRLVVVPQTETERELQTCELLLGDTGTGALVKRHREDLLMSHLENLLRRLGDVRDERKNILFVSEGWVPDGPATTWRNISVNGGDMPGVGVGPGGRIGIGQSMNPMSASSKAPWCNQMIQHLAAQDFDRRFRDLLTTARRANVSFYPVDVGGLKTGMNGDVSPAGPRSTLLTLAENTDGFAVVNTNDLQSGVRRISADLSTYYLLGYYSTNSSADGRFRRIEVKVAQPRVDVRARPGYFGPTAATLPTAAVATGPTAVDDALAALAVLRDGAEVFVRGATTLAGLDVAVEIATAAAGQPEFAKGGQVTVTVSDEGGATAEATTAIAAGERGARVLVPMPDAARGPWRIRAKVIGATGPVEAQAEVASVTAALVGMPLAWRGTPSPRVPLKPLADARLTRAERLRVEWPIVGESDTRTARLLDRRGQPLGAALPFATLPPERRSVAVDLPLSSLTEGDYVVELVAAKGETRERRLFAFRVVR